MTHAAERSSSDVVVVGGGPAGTSTAWALARGGASVLLVDRARFPREKPCAEYLSPQASRILHAMGALADVEAAGAAQLAGMEVRTPSGKTIRGDFVGSHGFTGFRDRGLALRRLTLDAILVDRARAAGVRVLEETRVSDLVVDFLGRVTGVRMLDSKGRERLEECRIVVGADGLRSIVARRLGIARSARWPRRLALVTHYRGVEGVTQRGEMHVHLDGYLGLADVGNGETNVAVVVPATRAPELVGDRAGFLERWIAQRPQLAPRFARAARISPVRVTGPFASHARRAWAPGAALVGDAADFFDPFTGEGIYAALRGGEMLAARVLQALASDAPREADEALRRYDVERRSEFGGKWKVERLVGAAVAYPPLLERAARVLSHRKDMADLLVGVTGDFVPAREVLRPRYLLGLLLPLSLAQRT